MLSFAESMTQIINNILNLRSESILPIIYSMLTMTESTLKIRFNPANYRVNERGHIINTPITVSIQPIAYSMLSFTELMLSITEAANQIMCSISELNLVDTTMS